MALKDVNGKTIEIGQPALHLQRLRLGYVLAFYECPDKVYMTNFPGASDASMSLPACAPHEIAMTPWVRYVVKQ